MDNKAEIREKVDRLAEKIKSDKDIAAKFPRDPIGTVESLLGIDLPDGRIRSALDMIKAKVKLDKVGDALGGLKGLFGK